MRHRSQGATALLGMPGFVVGAQLEVAGEWWLHVETTADTVGCRACGTRAVGHGRRRVKVRDLPVAGRPVVLVWSKRRWRCADGDCPVGTWTERSDSIGERAALTERARAEACRRVGQDEDSVAAVARSLGVGWHTVMAAVRDHGRPLVDDPGRLDGVDALGVDETRFLAATARRPAVFVTGFVDLRRARLLDVRLGRSGSVVRSWLDGRGADWLDGIDAVALDPFRGYANGLLAHLGRATVVVDHFHAVRLANRAVDEVRRRVQQDALGHRGRAGDPLYGIRRTLLRGSERLGQRGWDRLVFGLEDGDPDGQVQRAWIAKELLRRTYAAGTKRAARRRLAEFYAHCADADVPELTRLAKTVRAWETEVLAFHTTAGLSNGPTEAVNLLVEKIRRVGHGFRNFENYRLRLLLRCGVRWQTPATARIRGRQPRVVA